MSEPPAGLSVLPVAGLPEFGPGDDLAGAIARQAPWLADGDVVVVTSKVVSKVEGALVRVPPGVDREAARQAAIDGQTVRVVARRGPLKIVQTPHGWVVASSPSPQVPIAHLSSSKGPRRRSPGREQWWRFLKNRWMRSLLSAAPGRPTLSIWLRPWLLPASNLAWTRNCP